MKILGIEWVGITPDNAWRFFVSTTFVIVVVAISLLLRWLIGLVLRRTDHTTIQTKFWTRQGVSLFMALVLILGLLSIWFDNPARLATVFGLMSAGLAFALQQVITSIAGYFVILRGSTFTVGDRISMGGVRGDVMRLGFIQTTIMEMGQPPNDKTSDITLWVASRQFTGRIVTVANSKIFSEPVYNYTRDFPYIWEELTIPITYKADDTKAESILLAAAHHFAVDPNSMADDAKADLQSKYGIKPIDLTPRVYYRITDNWLELAVRFVVHTHGVRNVKDAMAREILAAFRAAEIGVASATFDIVGFPPVQLQSRTKS